VKSVPLVRPVFFSIPVIRLLYLFETKPEVGGRCKVAPYFFCCIAALSSSVAAQPPKGYTLTFSDDFRSVTTIDLDQTETAGFRWYVKPFFHGSATARSALSFGPYGLLMAPMAGEVAQLSTAGPADNATGYVGTVFRGGAYFEARIAFRPTVVSHPKAWPGFWTMAIEHLAGKGADQAPEGVRGFADFIEADIFEYDTAFAGVNTYGGVVHDWSGVYKKTCSPESYCDTSSIKRGYQWVIRLSPDVDWTKYHTFGLLWQPPRKGRLGTVQYFFDGKPMKDALAWMPGQPFSVIDRQGLVVILSTGADNPMHVQWVRVWQQRN